ncbi:replication protein P [Pantoea sp.]|uniref:replication protein P n=1 Tax=Pantoea sp. TaxID=69393 RepID=UPI00289AFB94|nr:replication protein P [Pantoea sp.]
MRNLVAAINNRDSSALARMAGDGPQPVDRGVNENIERLVDILFANLKVLFPASVSTVLRDPENEASTKRQWIVAFVENGITNKHQLSEGMKQARASESAFWPAPGQFIAWCKQGASLAAGLPDEETLYGMVMKYCRDRGLYSGPEEYPWESNAAYWMVTGLYSQMRSFNLTESELRARCRRELTAMSRRIEAGEEIQPPRRQIPQLHIPLTNEKGLDRIAELRRKHGLKR